MAPRYIQRRNVDTLLDYRDFNLVSANGTNSRNGNAESTNDVWEDYGFDNLIKLLNNFMFTQIQNINRTFFPKTYELRSERVIHSIFEEIVIFMMCA